MNKLDAWLRLLRISNLPTVWSNALAGYVLGLWSGAHGRSHGNLADGLLTVEAYFREGWPLLVAFSLIYLGGMTMNDALDAPADATARPTRPIPAGLISRRAATIATIALLVGGGLALQMHQWPSEVPPDPWVIGGGSALILAITAYNLLHARTGWSVLLMASCRALVTLTAAMAAGWSFGSRPGWAVPALALVIGGYTLGISVVARSEDESEGPGRKRLVVGMIAAMPAVDAAAMGMIGQWWVAGFCVGCAVVAAIAQRRVLGT
ncbi:MAG: UbiA family prenyltransferase [Phycisphaeraceae bacterium]